MPLGSPACGNCKNVDCTSAPKCFDYNGYDFGNCTYKNDIPKAIEMGLTSVSCTIVLLGIWGWVCQRSQQIYNNDNEI